MKCRNKIVEAIGIVTEGKEMFKKPFYCIITNDDHGKSLSINDGKNVQFTIPFKPIEKYLK